MGIETTSDYRGWGVMLQQNNSDANYWKKRSASGRDLTSYLAALNEHRKEIGTNPTRPNIPLTTELPQVLADRYTYFANSSKENREFNRKRMLIQDYLMAEPLRRSFEQSLTPQEKADPRLLIIDFGSGNFPYASDFSNIVKGSIIGLENDEETYEATKKKLEDTKGLDLNRVSIQKGNFTDLQAIQKIVETHRQKYGPDAPVIFYASLALVHIAEATALPFLDSLLENPNNKLIARNADMESMIHAVDYESDTVPNGYNKEMQLSVDTLKAYKLIPHTTKTLVEHFSQGGDFDINFAEDEIYEVDTSVPELYAEEHKVAPEEKPQSDAQLAWLNATKGVYSMIDKMVMGEIAPQLTALEPLKADESDAGKAKLDEEIAKIKKPVLERWLNEHYVPFIKDLSEHPRRGFYRVQQFSVQRKRNKAA